MSQAEEFLQDLYNLRAKHNNEIEVLIDGWVQKNRKYPNGFKFLYEGDTATITGATISIDHKEDFLIQEEAVYVVYTCYVPSICDNAYTDSGVLIGNRPNIGICVAEMLVDKAVEVEKMPRYQHHYVAHFIIPTDVDATSKNAEALEAEAKRYLRDMLNNGGSLTLEYRGTELTEPLIRGSFPINEETEQ